MLLLGEAVDAATAYRFGLVNKVVAKGEALQEAKALASTIAAKSPLTVRTGKQAFYAQSEMALEAAYAYASRVMVENMLARDAEEGIAAFVEKRLPLNAFVTKYEFEKPQQPFVFHFLSLAFLCLMLGASPAAQAQQAVDSAPIKVSTRLVAPFAI
eukprot:gene9435-12611_t